jgi:DNA recombination protein RmuC
MTSLVIGLAVVLALLAGGLGIALVALLRQQQGGNSDEAAIAELQRTVIEQRDATINAALQQLVTTNQAVIETERTRGAQELDGKKSLIDQQLATMSTAMTGELGRVTELMKELENDRERKFGQISQQLSQQHEGVVALMQTTQSLREALSSTKARGQWGERMAEDVLRLAGFVENVNYRKQRAIEGGRGIPDFTFFLPGELFLHMDAKFPLDNYLRCLEATSELDEKRYRGDFLRDVRQRVKDLGSRDYIDPGGGTVDFVLLFIPNEQLYAFIHGQDDTILEDAVRQGVVFCSPLSLFAVLALIRQTVDNFQLARTSDEILSLLGKFNDQWGKFVGQMDKVSARLDSAQKEFGALVGTRRNMLEKPLNQIDALRRQQPQLADVPDIELDDDGPGPLALDA